ncbi:MAG: hypothetical protein WD022_01800 [Balneolaceae bacterium]
MNRQASNIILPLIKNLNQKDFKGYDPYDIKAHPFLLKIIKWGNKAYPFEILREIILEAIYHFPKSARSFFNIQPTHNSKALGLMGTACVELSMLDEMDTKSLSTIQRRIDELLEKYKTGTSNGKGMGWGYPFDWQSRELIPAQTPNGIVTTAVGEYFWTQYKITTDKTFLKKCEQICHFLFSLPVDKYTDAKYCFSYVPHFQNHVHNLNLFVADFLIKTGIEVENNEWIESGHKALNYTIADQLENGAFDYNGPPEKPKNFIDNYHTGFVLRMLGSCYHYTQREDVKGALIKGLSFYLDNFFTSEGAPKLKPDKLYRIDIHSAAEAINSLVFLANYNEKALPVAEKVLKWTLNNLYDPNENDFFYAISKSRFTRKTYRSEIKYIRWSQAWMVRALSRYVLYSEENKIII